MPDGPQTHAKIQIDSQLDEDVLLATAMTGVEAISRPFLYTLTLLSRRFDVAPGEMLGKMVGIRVKRDQEEHYRGYSGFITAFSAGELHPKRREFRSYTIRVAPWLALLDQGARFRIFQDRDVLQIIDVVLRDAISNMFAGTASPTLYYSLRVQSSDRYPGLQYCVQYNETDFAFVSRLMEQHGIHYFFEQTDVNHKMIIVDGPPYKVNEDSPVAFVRSKDARGGVRTWTHAYTPQLRRWTFRDREYRNNPALIEKTKETVIAEVKGGGQGDQFAYPGGFAVLSGPGGTASYADMLAQTRIEEEETRYEVFSGNSVRVAFAAGTHIRIIKVAEQKEEERIPDEEEREYLLTSVSFTATEESYTADTTGEIVLKVLKETVLGGGQGDLGALGSTAKSNLPDVNKTINSLPTMGSLALTFGGGAIGAAAALVADLAAPILANFPVIGPLFKKPPPPPPYTNAFTAAPLLPERRYRPPSLTPKPRVAGPQTAIVFGVTPDDVATDELGRIKVKFDWDRTGREAGDSETNSCFLRVAQGWAGQRWGMQFLPRVGDEVLVDFIDGDPDRPIITGRVYNAVRKPPFELTKYRTQSGIKTRSLPLDEKAADRFHMLRFDDGAGSEQVLLRSQKRLDIRAFGSTFETTGGSRLAHIGYKDKDGQGGDFDITVGNDYQLHVQGGQYERIEKDCDITVKGQMVQDLEADATFMVKGTAALNAAKIVLEARQKISLKVGGNAIVIDPSGVTIVGTLVKINSGGAGEETPDASIEDPEDAAVSDTGEPGWLEKHKGGPGGGRHRRKLTSQHAIAPPRPGEPAVVTALRNRLNATPSGRNAMNVYDRDNVTPVVGVPGGGTFYTPPDGHGGGNTVTMDPTSSVPASDFVHEMNHADAQHSGKTPNINTSSRADYVNGMLAEESHGEVVGEQAHNELAAAGDPEAGNRNQFTGPVYDHAAQQGAADYQAAHPDASQSDIDAAGQAAGEKAVQNSFQSGNVTTSTPGNPSYPQYYGPAWDRAHPPPAGP
ncbi:MAG: type VI secretion system tip protein VgrG [Rhodospirillales bacterium]|nr:type VI secretion system tip protein VgrG [Rhodospirillales bacterium]